MDSKQSDILLPKLALLAMAFSQPGFKHIAAMPSGATVKPVHVRNRSLPTLHMLQQSTAGYSQPALVLTVLGQAHQAADALS